MSNKIPDIARKAASAIRWPRSAPAAAQHEGQAHESSIPPSEPQHFPEVAGEEDLKHGQRIYVFHHLQKHHVVYSHDTPLKNSYALSQLPFNGKKTKPAALRKDLWRPLLTLTFPTSPQIGLSAFQKLREYRKRHELEWRPTALKTKDAFNTLLPTLRQRDSFDEPIPKHKVARQLCDQKANSIADIAAVLERLNGSADMEAKGKIGLIGEGTGAPVKVDWADRADAGFAKAWSENVVFGDLENPRVTLKRRIEEKSAARRLKEEADEAAVSEEYYEEAGEYEAQENTAAEPKERKTSL